MTGSWIKREATAHVCDRPHHAPRVGGKVQVAAGDQWRCDTCSRVHTVTGLEHGVQWDPIDPPAITWDIPARLPDSERGLLP